MKKFNHVAKTFSKINLSYLSHCANLAYENKDNVATALSDLGLDTSSNNFFISNTETDTQAFVVGDAYKIIIAFRGTEGKIADWVTDIKIFKETWTDIHPLGEVHNGFSAALNSVWNQIIKQVHVLRDNQTIWITGHSLGGALEHLPQQHLSCNNHILA